MAMIQGIDGGALLQALRAGRQDRMDMEDRRAKQEAARAEAERKKQVGGLLGQLFGDNQPTVAGQFAPTNPQQDSFGEAFNPQAMDAIGRGENPPVGPGAPPAPMAPRRTPDPNILGRLIALDPETGGQIVTAFKNMSEANLKATEVKNTMMGAAAHKLMTVPEAQRPAVLRMIAPQLAAAGWTEQEISQANLTDQGLQMLQATAIDLDRMVDNEMAEREFNAGKVVSVEPGGMAVRIRPEGPPETIIAPNPGEMPAGGAADGIPPDAIEALRRGEGSAEQFDEIFGPGSAARVMGGGGSNVAGGFPGGAG